MAKSKPDKSNGKSGGGEMTVPVPGFDTKKLDAWLDTGVFDGAFSSPHMASALEKFVDRGEKVEDLLLRGHFRTANHMNAVVRLYRKAVHFQDTELQSLLLNHAAGYPAIGGLRIDILLKAVIGQYNQDRKRNLGQGLRDALGLYPKEGKQND